MTTATNHLSADIDTETTKLKRIFWDIESYDNLFVCGMLNDDDHLEMYYQVNAGDDEAVEAIENACQDSGYDFTLYDLSEDMSRFKWHFEKRIPRPTGKDASLLADFLGEADTPVEPKENWYFGYNTKQYDIPMIDHLITSSLANRLQTTPTSIREYSNALINQKLRFFDTKPYEQYANQVDCAYLNEKMIDKGRPTTGLKTLVGIKGGSIIESESNHSGHSDNIYSDVLYNINDIVELRDVVFPGVMASTFNDRTTLMETFPSLQQHGITVNDSSAKFVEFIVSPDGPIQDTETVTYMYPAPHIAKRFGVAQTDILEDTKQWYLENVFDVVKQNNPSAALSHLAKFMSIYNFYREFRGKNWNQSSLHAMEYGNQAHSKSERKRLLAEYGTYLPLINADGHDTGTYLNFSVGGIHGAEINHAQLKQDREKIAELREKYGKISMVPSNEVNTALFNLIKQQSRTTYQGYPQHFSHEIPYMYEQTEPVDEILDPAEFTPYMYTKTKDVRKEQLIKRYKYTSLGNTVHQDFDGYYVMLLINLGAFYDGKGKDVYDEIYQYRLSLKAKLKTLTYGTREYEMADIKQLGYKLVLNTASGILDGDFDTNLRANNKAIAMRVIG